MSCGKENFMFMQLEIELMQLITIFLKYIFKINEKKNPTIILWASKITVFSLDTPE